MSGIDLKYPDASLLHAVGVYEAFMAKRGRNKPRDFHTHVAADARHVLADVGLCDRPAQEKTVHYLQNRLKHQLPKVDCRCGAACQAGARQG